MHYKKFSGYSRCYSRLLQLMLGMFYLAWIANDGDDTLISFDIDFIEFDQSSSFRLNLPNTIPTLADDGSGQLKKITHHSVSLLANVGNSPKNS